jgi:hypothetical protein
MALGTHPTSLYLRRSQKRPHMRSSSREDVTSILHARLVVADVIVEVHSNVDLCKGWPGTACDDRLVRKIH